MAALPIERVGGHCAAKTLLSWCSVGYVACLPACAASGGAVLLLHPLGSYQISAAGARPHPCA